MRITHYLARFRLADGGVMRAVIDLCAALARAGHQISIITADGTDLPEEWRANTGGPPRIIMFDRRPAGIGAASRRIIDRALDAAGVFDVLHLHTPWDPVNRHIAARASQRGIPCVVSVHGMLDDWSMAQKPLKKRLYLALGGRAVLERAAVIHCTAQAELDQAKKWFPLDRGIVVPLIFNCAAYAALPGPEPARIAIQAARTDLPIILFLSRLHEKKRPEMLIDAAKILRDDGRAFRVILAGSGESGYEQSLRERIRAASLDEVVHLAGLVTGKAKVSLFEIARVFVLPTSQENFGFVYLESLAAGTPVITTRGTDTWRELHESGGAAIVERDDAGTFAREIGRMLNDPARAESMGAAGRKWVFDHFAGDAVLREFETMYEGAIHSTGA